MRIRYNYLLVHAKYICVAIVRLLNINESDHFINPN